MMKIKSVMNSSMFVLMIAGLFALPVHAQTKLIQKPSKKDTIKKELPAKGPKKEEKKDPLVGSRPVMHPKPAKKN